MGKAYSQVILFPSDGSSGSSALKRFIAFIVKGEICSLCISISSFLGQQLDEFLQLAVDKVEAGLGSGPYRSQAFTLLLWVRSRNGFSLKRDNYVWLSKISPFDLEP